MNFGFSEEQEQLRDSVRRFLDDKAPLPAVRELAASDSGFSRDHWQAMADLGWLGLLVPAEQGGLGLGWVDTFVLLEEMGRSLFPSPYLGHVLAQATLRMAGNDSQCAALMPGLVDGSRIATVALLDEADWPTAESVVLAGQPAGDGFVLQGRRGFVGDAGNADLLLVAFRVAGSSGEQGLRLALLQAAAAGISRSQSATMDSTRRVGTLTFDNVQVPADALLCAGGDAWPVLQQVLDLGALAVTAEAVGTADQALQITAAYARERIQFGKPIGQYQSVKHRLAEQFVDVESTRSLACFAAWAADNSPLEQFPAAVSQAKALASEAFARLGIQAVELHGAIGFTAEYDIQLYLKRSKWLRAAFGDADFHYERVAQLGAA